MLLEVLFVRQFNLRPKIKEVAAAILVVVHWLFGQGTAPTNHSLIDLLCVLSYSSLGLLLSSDIPVSLVELTQHLLL